MFFKELFDREMFFFRLLQVFPLVCPIRTFAAFFCDAFHIRNTTTISVFSLFKKKEYVGTLRRESHCFCPHALQ